MELKPGQWLHASCSAEWYEILAVGTDGNGAPTIDIDVPDINEFIECRWDADGEWQKPESDRYCKPSLILAEQQAQIEAMKAAMHSHAEDVTVKP